MNMLLQAQSALSSFQTRSHAAEAHKLGMTVTGHIPEGLTAFDGVTAGMDQINHISYIV